MKAKVERDIESKLHLYIKKDDTLHQKGVLVFKR